MASTTLENQIAMGFVVYQPEATLLSRLQLVRESGLPIFVFDNSPDSPETRTSCDKDDACEYMTCGKNVGLGIALAAICAQAYYKGFRSLLFFDQDTIFTNDTLRYIQRFSADHDLTAYSAIVFNAKDISRRRTSTVSSSAVSSHIEDVTLAISSGSLFILDNVRSIGWHNHRYFVDCVDYEFCLRSSNRHLKIGEHRLTPDFDHQSEQPDHRIVLGRREWRIRRYPWWRIRDTIVSTLRLLMTSVSTGNARFFFALTRATAIYFAFQLAARVPGRGRG